MSFLVHQPIFMVRTRTRGQTQTVWMLFCRSMGPDLAIKHSVFPLPDFPYPIWYLRNIPINKYIYIYVYIYIHIHISYRYTLIMNIWVMYKFRSTPSRCIGMIPVLFSLSSMARSKASWSWMVKSWFSWKSGNTILFFNIAMENPL